MVLTYSDSLETFVDEPRGHIDIWTGRIDELVHLGVDDLEDNVEDLLLVVVQDDGKVLAAYLVQRMDILADFDHVFLNDIQTFGPHLKQSQRCDELELIERKVGVGRRVVEVALVEIACDYAERSTVESDPVAVLVVHDRVLVAFNEDVNDLKQINQSYYSRSTDWSSMVKRWLAGYLEREKSVS